jgi:hypothetical protein
MNAAAQLRDLDAQAEAIAAKRASVLAEVKYPEPIVALRALGVPDASEAWRHAQVQTRIWQLEIQSGDVTLQYTAAAFWQREQFRRAWNVRFAYAERPMEPRRLRPIEEWNLWLYVKRTAEAALPARIKRDPLHPAYLTEADLEEARLRLEIDATRWQRARARAAWVLR